MITNINQPQQSLGGTCQFSDQTRMKLIYNEENKTEDIYTARNQVKLTLRKQKLKSTLENEKRIQMMIKNAPKNFKNHLRFNLSTLENYNELNNELFSNKNYKDKLTCINYMLERNNYDSKVFAICSFYDLVDIISDEIGQSEISLFIVQPMISNLILSLKLVQENVSLAVSFSLIIFLYISMNVHMYSGI